MTCSHNKRELKCKWPPCPCQICAQLRGEKSKNDEVPKRCCRDTPPERPIPKYQFQPKCAGKLETIGPKYQPKYQYTPTQPPPSTCCEEQKKECDDCYTGIGCCNTGRNFLAFMINLIGYIAFIIISALVFWLIVCHWVVVLGFKVYHAKRTTRIAVVSVIGLLFLLIFCTAGWKAYKKGSTQQAVTKTQSSSMFSFKWRKSKPDEPPKSERGTWFATLKWSKSKGDTSAQSESGGSWFSSRKRSKPIEDVPVKSEGGSWFSSLKRSKPKEDIPAKSEGGSWFSLKWGHSKPPTQPEPESAKTPSSSWLPSFKWRHTTMKESVQPSSEARSSWIPFFRGRGQATTTTEIVKTETRSYWISWRTSTPAQTTATKTEARASWLPWRHGTTTEIEKQPASRSSWLSWRRTSKPVQIPVEAEARSSWIPSFKWGRKEAAPMSTTVEVRSSWTSYFTKQKPPPPPEPPARSSWTSYLQWHKATTKSIEKQSKEAEKHTSWLSSFKWGQKKEMDIKIEKSDGRAISWLPSFNCGRPQSLQISHDKTEKTSWLPSFNWGRKSAAQKSASCKTCNAKSACEMRQHKVTVSIDDEEANRIFKQSKMYAIPTEMKHPPQLVIFLRDHLIQSSA